MRCHPVNGHLWHTCLARGWRLSFGKIQIVESEEERTYAAYLLGIKYNPGDEAGLQKELEKGLPHALILRLDIEHLTGKEAIELARRK